MHGLSWTVWSVQQIVRHCCGCAGRVVEGLPAYQQERQGQQPEGSDFGPSASVQRL